MDDPKAKNPVRFFNVGSAFHRRAFFWDANALVKFATGAGKLATVIFGARVTKSK